MGSSVIYYEYKKREKFEDYDLKADAELGTFKIRRYHFEDESFVHPLHSVRFDPDRLYEVPIEALMTDQPLSSSDKGRTSARGSHRSRRSSPTPHYLPRMSSSTHRVASLSPTVASSSVHRRVAGKTLRPPKSWKFSLPSEGWMCEGDGEEKENGGMEPSVEKEEASKEDEEDEDPEDDPEENEEEDPEEEVSASTSLPMDVDADEDYLQYLEVLQNSPEYSSIHCGHASIPDLPEDSSVRRSVSHDTPSYDLSRVWPSPSSGQRV
ncbi:hypothetical protein PIB30_064192 [Stylosanthes scabra]|uniref:Uncharacterized protein n=1 Tax=Stylosanthes scabra TaxID=79078 RepID=A0ABU6SNH0_9FABA|nr:hypothetical protein [Stylosanthes scabra]